MSWSISGRGPMINAREKWQAQEHGRRVRLLGEWLAEDWEMVVEEFADAYGKVHKEKVLQLMEDVWRMAGGSNADDLRTGSAPADGGEPEAQVRPLHHEAARGITGSPG